MEAFAKGDFKRNFHRPEPSLDLSQQSRLTQRGVFSVSASASRASAKQMMSQYLLNSQTVWEVFLPFLETNDLFLKLTYEYVEISLQQQPSLIQFLEQNSSCF